MSSTGCAEGAAGVPGSVSGLHQDFTIPQHEVSACTKGSLLGVQQLLVWGNASSTTSSTSWCLDMREQGNTTTTTKTTAQCLIALYWRAVLS